MKVFKLIVVTIFLTTISMAQTPQAIKYQAVIRDLDGTVLANKNVALRIEILLHSVDGVTVYSELHERTSNAFGLIDLEIGNSNSSNGDFSAIDWANGTYFIKVELDENGGNNFQPMGVSQLLSVPYALFAQNAANGFSGDYNDLLNKPLLFDGTWTSLTGKPGFAPVATNGSYYDLSNRPVTDGSETKITEGNYISVTGTGTSENPYKISSTVTHFAGELFGGGIVFYVDQSGQHGLIVSMIDLPAEKWSNVFDSVGVAAASPWNGQSNTNAIIAQNGHSASAAKLCFDYTNADYGTGIYSDWFLPAINQLTQLYSEIYVVNKTLESDDNSATTLMFNKPYWSSTENWNIFARDYAYFFNFETFVCDRYSKSNPLIIRAIRSF